MLSLLITIQNIKNQIYLTNTKVEKQVLAIKIYIIHTNVFDALRIIDENIFSYLFFS